MLGQFRPKMPIEYGWWASLRLKYRQATDPVGPCHRAAVLPTRLPTIEVHIRRIPPFRYPMTAPITSTRCGCRMGLALTGKAPLLHGARQKRIFELPVHRPQNKGFLLFLGPPLEPAGIAWRIGS